MSSTSDHLIARLQVRLASPNACHFLGLLLLAMMVMVGLEGWFGLKWLQVPSAVCLLIVFSIVAITGSPIARLFITISIMGILLAFVFAQSPQQVVWAGVERALFFQAFMTAVFTLQESALNSGMLRKIGLYMLDQPLQSRSLLVLVGTHILSIMMNLGSLVLIGSIAQADKKPIPTSKVEHDIGQKQVALSAVRGFSPSSMWSPLSLPPVFISTLMPGVPLSTLIPCGFAISLFMLCIAAFVTRFELHVAAPPKRADRPRIPVPVKSLLKLGITVAIIFISIETMSGQMSISIATTVTLLIPFFTIIWLWIQSRGRLRALYVGPLKNMISIRLPQQASETSVIVAAGFIGPILLALIPFDHVSSFIQSTQMPSSVLVSVIFLAVIGFGLVGFNPILSITIAAAAFSKPELLGISQLMLMLVLLTAWSITAQFSPFTATTIVTGRLFGVSSRTLTLSWNAVFCLVLMGSTLVAIFLFDIMPLPQMVLEGNFSHYLGLSVGF